MPSSWIIHRGKRILKIDLTHVHSETDLVLELEAASSLGMESFSRDRLKYPVLVDYTGLEVNQAVFDAIMGVGRRAHDRIHKIATLGVTGLKSMMQDIYRLSTSQEVRRFDDESSALDWLSE